MLRRKHNTHDDQDHDALQGEKVKQLKSLIGPLSGHSLMFCTDACLRRYLEARNWNINKSKKMLEETLKRRVTYKPEEIHWHEVAIEGETGKVYRANFHDLKCRTVLVLRPGKQRMPLSIYPRPKRQEQMIWLIDFTGWSLGNSVPVKIARETANILQSHYPERPAAAFLYNPPRIFEPFWKIIKYFLDPKTFQKVKFYPKNQDSMGLMHKNFDFEVLPKEFGGKNKVQYDHEEFSKMMTEDDMKTATIWRLDEKTTPPNHAVFGNSTAEVVPEPAYFATQAS